MPALGAGIHDLLSCNKDVDGRVKPGHDDLGTSPAMTTLAQARPSRLRDKPGHDGMDDFRAR
jgi:hypothetical protein